MPAKRKRDAKPTASSLKKVKATFELPTAAGLRTLEPEDIELLEAMQGEVHECVYNNAFRKGNAETAMLEQAPAAANFIHMDSYSESDLDSDFGIFSNVRAEVLTADEERHMFMAFNYCRHRVQQILRKYRGKRLPIGIARELVKWQNAALTARGEIARINISLVLAMARRARIHGVELSELVCEGNFALVRCIDKFDSGRGFKFSTYACRAILSAFTRAATKGSRFRSHFPVQYDDALEPGNEVELRREEEEERTVHSLRSVLKQNSALLNEIEQEVIAKRFALDDESVTNPSHAKGKTLEELGNILGVSKERVRQIQNRALGKLRTVMIDEIALYPTETEDQRKSA